MRILAALLLTAILAAAPAATTAQSLGLEIEVRLEGPQFLPGEDIPVAVRIANLSGRTLTFGTTSNWLTFYAETKDGEIVTRLGQVPVLGEFSLESAKAGTKWWNIRPYFDLDQPGSYLLYAELRLPEWEQRLVSDPAPFTIQSSRSLWDVNFGVPNTVNPDQPGAPVVRQYALLAATRDKERKLYARAMDPADGHIFRVLLLDRLLSFSNPQQQLDNASRLHVLFQTAGSSYTYCVVNPDGELVGRERHDIIPGSRPRLAKADDGSISVQGGKRAPTPSDIPPYQPPPASVGATTNNPVAAVTNPPPTDSEKRRESRRRRGSGQE